MERSGGTIEHAIHVAVAVAVAAIVAIRDIVVQVGVWRRRAQPGLQGAVQ